MSFTYEERLPDSPFVETIWRTRAESDGRDTAAADGRWEIIVIRQSGRLRLSVSGPMTKAAPVSYTEGDEYLGIRFKLGTFMPYLPPRNLLDGAALVPQATRKTFWLGDSHWQLPDYENVETFVARLVRSGMLVRDPIVGAVLQDRATDMSLRSVRRRFLLATGLTQSTIRQIERARHASALLQQGVSILDTVYQAGYADQPHMTRSLKRFIGQTPAQIVRVSNP
jgi:AraC-like DNA-binding protein